MTIKKILLLGATGQIGKELAYECKNNKEIEITCHSREEVKSSFFNFHKIKNIVGNLDDENIIKEIKSSSLVFDLAAPDSGTLKEIKNFYKKRIDNVIPNMTNNSKYVFASTMNAFGIDSKRKKLKNYLISSSIYASNKRYAEKYLINIGKKNNVDTYILRLAEVHGKFQRASLNIIKLIQDKRIFEIPSTPAWITFVSLIKSSILNILLGKEKPGMYTLVCDDIFWSDLLIALGNKANTKPKYLIKKDQQNMSKLRNLLYSLMASYKDIFRGNFEISKNQENLMKLNYRVNKIKNSLKENNKLKIYSEYNRYSGILPGKRIKSLKYKKEDILNNISV